MNTSIPTSIPRDDFSRRVIEDAIDAVRSGDSTDLKAVYQTPMVKARTGRIIGYLQAIGVIPGWKVTPDLQEQVFMFAIDVLLAGMPLEGGAR